MKTPKLILFEMSRHKWRLIVALIGLILMGTGGVITLQLSTASQQDLPDYSYQPAAKPSFQLGKQGKPISEAYQPNCQNPQTYENADLCAQWAAVEQVAESNRMASLNLRFAIASLWASIIGTILLLGTLVQTRETARRELRAYLFVQATGIVVGTAKHNLGRAVSIAVVRNSGATPAHRVSHYSAIEIAPFNEENRMQAPAKLEQVMQNTVPPQGEISADRLTVTKPTRAEIAGLRRGDTAIFVYGAIEYRDVFDRLHRTDYRLYYVGPWPPPESPSMRFCTEGNTAT